MGAITAAVAAAVDTLRVDGASVAIAEQRGRSARLALLEWVGERGGGAGGRCNKGVEVKTQPQGYPHLDQYC
jgi:hypothetical protein